MNDGEKLLKNVGLRIRSIRLENKISQQDLAASCNFEKSNMCRIEMGKNNLTLKTLQVISKALGVPLKELINFKENYGK